MGGVPTDVKYIDSLLVFNSSSNPYRRYEIVENNKPKKLQKVNKNNLLEAVRLEEAPSQMNVRIGKRDEINFSYVPRNKEVKDEGFKEKLDLVGIVDFMEDSDEEDVLDMNELRMKKEKTVEKKLHIRTVTPLLNQTKKDDIAILEQKKEVEPEERTLRPFKTPKPPTSVVSPPPLFSTPPPLAVPAELPAPPQLNEQPTLPLLSSTSLLPHPNH